MPGRDVSPNTSPAPVRLFGFDLAPAAASPEPKTLDAASTQDEGEPSRLNGERKFKCQYCCLRFPTSHALGGHQNAHKHQRALLQFAAAGHHFHHSHAGSFLGGHHVYGYLHVPSASRFDQCHPPPPRYPSWVAQNPAAARFYPGIWGMPGRAQVEQRLPLPVLPLFGGKGVAREAQGTDWMELPSSKSISDRSDMKPSFRKPSSEVASRKYRRHSPSARSDSSSSGGGSPRRERSRSPQHSKEDHSRISDDHWRKDPGREIERESTRSRSNRVHDSHKYSEKHPYNNFNDYRRRDDYSRHDRHVDEENRNYKWSSRSARNDNHSDYTRSERTSDRYRDNWRKVDEHSRDRNENSEHRSKSKEKVCMKDYDKIDAGKKQVGLSRDYDPDHDHHRDREFRDRIRSYRRSPTSEDMDKSSEKDIHAEDMILKRKPHEKEGNQHKEKYASKREVIQDERRSLFSSREIDGKKEKKVDEVSDMIDKNSSRELKAGNLERDDEQLSSSRQVNSTNVEAKHDSVNPNTNKIEGTGDVNSAKDAAMKAAELVNRNLVGFGGVGFLSADQKKKLLWGNKKNNSTEESSSCWDLHLFPDQERQEKFNRLMGVKGSVAPDHKVIKDGDLQAKKREELDTDLEKQYTAGLRRRDGRTVGLGL